MQLDETPQIAMEDGVIVKFYIQAVKDEFKTKTENRPVFINMEMVEIMLSGDNKTVINEIVKDHHRNRFPQSYKAFKEGTILVAQGYPISKWDVLDPATKATLKYMNVHTVEQLAEMHDGVIGNLGMGAHEMREKARKHVKANYVDPQIQALKDEIEKLKANGNNGAPKRSEKVDTEEDEVPAFEPSKTPKRMGRPPKDLPPHMKAE